MNPLNDAAAPRRRAKIVCTIGPASNSEAGLRDLMRAGMDVARLNFSHGTHEEHARVIERLRKVAARERRSICILQDLQGPKIRTGALKGHTPVTLATGAHVTITPREAAGTAKLISTTFTTLARDVEPGSRILLSDGLIELRVAALRGDDVDCEVINGGLLKEHQGINLPGTVVSVPSLTEKDEKDLDFGVRQGVDVIAMSFVRTAEDVLAAKRRVADRRSDIPIIAKLEKPQAIEHLDEIFDAADGVMVARGDLGVELPPETVPVIQKKIIHRAMAWRKPVITATQMLESMIEHPRPTRAEASDVANAVFDGTDALMLSAETASGNYPREAAAMMARIIIETEQHMLEQVQPRRRERRVLSIAETICEAIAHAALELDMRAIAVYTETGRTARMISKYRPKPVVYSFSTNPAVVNRANLLWGVHPVLTGRSVSLEHMVEHAESVLRDVLHVGDVIGVVAGTQKGAGSTNFMRLHVVGSPTGGFSGLRQGTERRRAPRQRKPRP